jgi:hypothetical protein
MECRFCGKPLSNTDSVALGVGPECAGRQQAVGAAVGALRDEIGGVCAEALSDDLVQRRLVGYERALKGNNKSDAQRLAESALRWANELLRQRAECSAQG